MNENVFGELLNESLQREYAEFDNAPEHKFSLGHRISMKRIFARYDRNVRSLTKAENIYITVQSELPYYSLKQRMIIALVIIVLMTLLTGWFIPIRGITEAQIDWLRSRYDFQTMKIDSLLWFSAGAGLQQETNEFGSFLADLVEMGIYSSEEANDLRIRTMPIDTRPKPAEHEYTVTAMTVNYTDRSPLDIFRNYVSDMENEIEFYNKRAKNPDKAVEGDTDFADLIAEHYLPLPKSFLELLEKLFADTPDEEGENQTSYLAELDKDRRAYLSEIHKI